MTTISAAGPSPQANKKRPTQLGQPFLEQLALGRLLGAIVSAIT